MSGDIPIPQVWRAQKVIKDGWVLRVPLEPEALLAREERKA